MKKQRKLSIGEDTLLFASCIKNANRVVHLDKAMYRYCINEDSVTAEEWTEKKNDELIAREMICDICERDTKLGLSAKQRVDKFARLLLLNTVLARIL